MTRGFSLVELSIVLVILGLLVGGVLSGQSLIRAAEIRAVTTEYQRYNAAVQSFRDKYFSIPGDMNNATAFWGKDDTNCASDAGTAAATGTCNGNGNGLVDITSTGASSRSEAFAFWKHLALGGLIEGSYTGLSGTGGAYESNLAANVPRSRVSNAGWTAYYFTEQVDASNPTAFEGTYGNIYFFGKALGGTQTWGEALKPEEAWNIDTKIDDGKPGIGLIRVRKDQAACYTNGPTAAGATYALTTSSLQCGFLIKM